MNDDESKRLRDELIARGGLRPYRPPPTQFLPFDPSSLAGKAFLAKVSELTAVANAAIEERLAKQRKLR